jgi:alpha-mannosidase
VEWPLQGWSRLKVNDQHLALVTNDAYSLSLQDDVWQWTLLRSPKMAWGGGEPEVYSGHDHFTDQGAHVFAFEMHASERLEASDLHVVAKQQVQPVIVFDRYEGMDRPLWGSNKARASTPLFKPQGEEDESLE